MVLCIVDVGNRHVCVSKLVRNVKDHMKQIFFLGGAILFAMWCLVCCVWIGGYALGAFRKIRLNRRELKLKSIISG